MKLSKRMVHCATITVLGAAIIAPQISEAGPKKAKPLLASMVFDAEKRKKTKSSIGQRMSYSLYASMRFQDERNRIRDDNVDDRNEESALYLGFVGRADLGRGMIAFGHGELDARSKTTHIRSYGMISHWTTKEAFISLKVSPNARLTFGRLRFSDLNKWGADAAVDGIHYGHKTADRVTELAAIKAIDDNASSYLMAHHGRVKNKISYGALALIENQNEDTRFHLTGYANTVVSQRFSYELNAGVVAGDAANGKSIGFGADLRTLHKFGKSQLNPQVMFGFAAATEGYRQSGLQSNKTYNKGQTQVHRYGYAFQPDLTNLAVGSVAIGIRPSRKFSLDLGLHVYGQLKKSNVGPNARLLGATTGNSAFLGTEISLVGAWRPNKKSKVEFGVGHFNPGPAFVDQSSATRVYMRMTISF
jgi:hypothetical protein